MARGKLGKESQKGEERHAGIKGDAVGGLRTTRFKRSEKDRDRIWRCAISDRATKPPCGWTATARRIAHSSRWTKVTPLDEQRGWASTTALR